MEQKLDSEKMLKYLKEQLSRTNYWLSFAEAKNAAIITLNIAIMANIDKLYQCNYCLERIHLIILAVSTGFSIYSFIPNLFKAEFKRKDTSQKGGHVKLNLMFYGDIAKLKDVNDYFELTKKLYYKDAEKCREQVDLAEEVLQNSKITVKKYKISKLAIIIDLMGLVICLLNLISTFI